MPIILPKGRRLAVSKSPSTMFLYGPPKVGKTEVALQLANSLLIDLEKGSEAHAGCIIEANNLSQYNEVLAQIRTDTATLRKEPGMERAYPYDFLIIDPIDKLADFCEAYCTSVYNAKEKKRAEDKREKPEYVQTIYDLAFGKGYYYVREEMKGRLEATRMLCKKMIIIGHIKDKALNKKAGVDILDTEINLTGQLSTIVTSYCDAIGFVYRDPFAKDEKGNNKLMVSFETLADSINMGARHEHLRGKRLPLDWNVIYQGEAEIYAPEMAE